MPPPTTLGLTSVELKRHHSFRLSQRHTVCKRRCLVPGSSDFAANSNFMVFFLVNRKAEQMSCHSIQHGGVRGCGRGTAGGLYIVDLLLGTPYGPGFCRAGIWKACRPTVPVAWPGTLDFPRNRLLGMRCAQLYQHSSFGHGLF